jgi:serine/threonine protein phosphatase PrpC
LDQEVCRQEIPGGSTALVVTVDERKVAMAHLGDSSAVLVRNGQPLSLISPHHPERIDEFKRIDSSGGVILPRGNSLRVNG